VKLNDPKICNFLKQKKNSCRFDCILALFFFIANENLDLLKKMLEKEIFEDLMKIFDSLDGAEYEKAQTDFIDLCRSRKLCEESKPSNFGSIHILYENFMKNAPEDCFLKFSQAYWCRNKKCPVAKEIDLNPYRLELIHDYCLDDLRDCTDNIIENFS